MGTSLKVAIYARVSSNAAADADTIRGQVDDLTKWAKAQGHKIVSVCEDEAVSGKLAAAEREGLSCVLDAIESGNADAVLIRGLDRLARELTVQEATLAMVWKMGGRVLTVNGEVLPDDDADPMRTAMRQMMGVFAQLERATVVGRLRAGRERKLDAGGYAHGAPAYGYKTEDGQLVKDQAETAVVETIADLRSGGMSLKAIADKLNADGVPTKRGGKWHPATVSRIADPAARERANADARLHRAMGQV